MFKIKKIVEKGYMLCAVGEKYVKESEIAIASLRKFVPDAHVTIVTDVEVESTLFDNVIHVPIDERNHQNIKLYKPKGLLVSPYQRTFYIDTDIYFCDSCEELFGLLDFYDLLVAHDVADMLEPVWKGRVLHGLYSYNNGMFVYRKNDKTDLFLKTWIGILEDEWEQNKYGQSSFLLGMMAAELVTYTLTAVYNFRAVFYQGIPKTKVKIIHARDINLEKFERIINQTEKSRAWDSGNQRLVYKRPASLWKRGVNKWRKITGRKRKRPLD